MWENKADAPVITGLSRTRRQVLISTTLDAAPDHRYDLGGESIWPMLLAVGVGGTLMIGGIFNPWAAPFGVAFIALVLFGWFWTSKGLRDDPPKAADSAQPRNLWWLGVREREKEAKP
jgi:cytochrome c oxidase subunit 1